MKKQYTLHMTERVTSKLQAVKKLKELTGMGLKDSKDKFDELVAQFDRNLHSNASITVDIIDERKTIIEELNELGIEVSGNNNRENNLTDVLTNITVFFPKRELKYCIFEGDYEILENNAIQLNIVSGVIKNTHRVWQDEEISNMKTTLPFNECVIEEELE